MDALLSKASSKSDSAASKSLGKKLVEGLGAKKDKVEKERRDRYNVFCNNLKWCNKNDLNLSNVNVFIIFVIFAVMIYMKKKSKSS